MRVTSRLRVGPGPWGLHLWFEIQIAAAFVLSRALFVVTVNPVIQVSIGKIFHFLLQCVSWAGSAVTEILGIKR